MSLADIVGDTIKMLVPGTAASTPNVNILVPPGKVTHHLSQLLRVTLFDMTKSTKRDLVHFCGIGT